MNNPLFYQNPVTLNENIHREVRLPFPSVDFRFAQKGNAVPLTVAEFSSAAREFAIVFSRTSSGEILPCILTGFRTHENLFVDEQGRWLAHFIPGYLQRYPFILATMPGSEQFTVCYDKEYCPTASDAERALALFNPDGGQSPELQKILAYLEQYQAQLRRTDQFVAALKNMDLLKEFSAKIDTKKGENYNLTGLLIVDESKLTTLSEQQVYTLFRSGELGLIYLHLWSITNSGRLLNLLNEKEG